MKKTSYENYFNRELSWLEFNERVLNQAQRQDLPLLERLKFLSITASNMDEFFMVRVGGLQMLVAEKRRRRDLSGLTPNGQLKAISGRTHCLYDALYTCFTEELEPALAAEGIERIKPETCNETQMEHLERLFENELYSILTPMALDRDKAFPLLSDLGVHVAFELAPREKGRESRFALIPLGHQVRRFITLPSEGLYQYMLMQDVIPFFQERWFPGEKIIGHIAFRITRNADMSVQEDSAYDLLSGMEDVLEQRKISHCVRLEARNGISQNMLNFLKDSLGVQPHDIYLVNGPVGLADFQELAFMEGFDRLKDEAWPPLPEPGIDPRISMFDHISDRDLLLCHPYESFDPVVRLIEEAAQDPQVLAIKQILYRTSSRSPIISALKMAARKGKYVTVIVELKARFDEQRNIEWAKQLELEGVQVIYGIKGLKTHAKLCIIVKREARGIVKYLHVGTGNYNDSTARIYSDISYMTKNEELGRDATTFFNSISGFSEVQPYVHLSMSPGGIRDRMLECLDEEITRARQGQKGWVMAKMNSLVDQTLIDKLYEASGAGVTIQLNIRGICCLRPGVAGVSENITVTSIIDRLLEHARIYYFHRGGAPIVFISSADWMNRNLDKRIELLTPIIDKASKKKLIKILKMYFKDNTSSWELLPDGKYLHSQSKSKQKACRSQERLYQQAAAAIEARARSKRTTFEPHKPADTEST